MGTKVQQSDDDAAAAANAVKAAATTAAEAAATHSNANATTTTTVTTTAAVEALNEAERATTPTQKTTAKEEHNSKTPLPTHATPTTTTTSTVTATTLAPTASPPPQVLIIPAAQASTMATNAAKKIRRAFSMPRNPFRWSRKFKTIAGSAGSASGSDINGGGVGVAGSSSSSTAISSCMNGGRGRRSGSIVSLNSYKAASVDAPPMVDKDAIIQNKSATIATGNGSGSSSGSGTNNSGKRAAGQNARVMRRSSFRKFLNRIAQHLSARVNVGANKHGMGNGSGGSERVPPIGGYQWPADQTPGVMGLKNHGNTCFMNAVLQCLSHTDILAEYFVLDQYKADLKRRNKINSRKFGTKGELTEQLANVLKALWTCRNESDHSTSFKAVVDRYGTQFRSSTQHDAQEFLFWLLDKVHEDLNTASKRRYKSIKNSYGRSDEIIAAETLANHIRCNNSFVQAVFQAQFRSSLTCPRCQKQSNTFDPFHCISVQLPQLTQLTIFVTVVFMKQQPRQLKMGLRVPAGSPIVALREQLQETGIAANRMVLVDLNAEGFTRVFYDTQPVDTLSSVENIYCIEVPEVNESTPKAETAASAEGAEKQSSSAAAAPATAAHSTDLLLLVANVHKKEAEGEAPAVCTRFGAPFSMKAPRDCSYQDLQKRMLREMSALLKPEVFSYATPLTDMFKIRLQDPSADPDTYLEQVEHPLLTEMIDMALSVLSSEAGPTHIKLLLEWTAPETHFVNINSDVDAVVEHESVARLSASKPNDTAALTLEQCLEHYTKAETLSAEDAWRCPHCQQYLPVVKTLGLWSLPDILVVHFKRFRQHQAKGPQAAKLTTMVKFPLTAFDMSPHLARGVRESSASGGGSLSHGMDHHQQTYKKSRGDSRSSTLNSRAEPKDTRYDLYAVCYHQGDTLETGHYTAACKNPYDRQWYKFDDQRVSKVPEDDIEQDIINNEAYMLFYQRRTADASAECSGSSSNSGDHWVSRIAPPAAAAVTATTVAAGKEKEEDTVEPIAAPAEKAVSKPVAIPIPKAACEIEDVTPVPDDKPDAVDRASHEVLNIEELAYADADAEAVADSANQAVIAAEVEPAVLPAASATTSPTSVADVTKDAAQIFAMDEDCAEKPLPSQAVNGEASVSLASAVVASESISQAQEPKTNGHAASSGGNSSTSSSASSIDSLSSRSSPRSLSTSVTAASTLQNKFNGHVNAASAAAALLNGNAAPQLSSSLQLSRHAALHNHCNHNWHGSRSSVSAVESVTQHQQQQQQQQQQQAAAASLSLRHSFSTSSNYKLRECSETLSSLLRNSANTCSKDTLLFIDQQNHHHTSGLIEDDDDSYMGRSLWISPVTPHKLITVSPKN